MILRKLTAAVLLGFAAVGSAGAVAIVTPNETINADAIDWTQTSFLAVGGVDAIQNFTTPDSTSFTVYTHAKMTTYSDGSTSGISPAGINDEWEITIVGSFEESVQSVGGATATFEAQATTGFFQMYLDTSPDANDLAGTGFNDGTLIAVGTLSNSPTGLFLVTSADGVLLDQFNDDDWGGQLTVSGIGTNADLAFAISAFDATVFTGGISDLSIVFQNVSMQVPFGTVDPSMLFSDELGRGATDVGDDFTSSATIAPNIGGLNGASGPDFLAQTDFNSAVRAAVPLPATAALFGIGLIGIGALARRKQALN